MGKDDMKEGNDNNIVDFENSKSFYVVKAEQFKLNLIYKVFISNLGLYGARVGKEFYDENIAYAQLGDLYNLFKRRVAKSLSNRIENEKRYKNKMSNEDFLAIDKLNFYYDIKSFDKVIFNSKHSMLTYELHSKGTFEFYLRDNSKHKYILVYDQDLESIIEAIKEMDIDIDFIHEERANFFAKMYKLLFLVEKRDDAEAKEKEEWLKIKPEGKMSYLLKEGFFEQGIKMAFTFTIVMSIPVMQESEFKFTNESLQLLKNRFLINFIIWPAFGLILSYLTWNKYEQRYENNDSGESI